MNKNEVIKNYSNYAESHGFKINPDKEIVDMIINGLSENEKKYGFRYCPCRVITENKVERAKMICPCVWHKSSIKRDGKCHCELFVRGE